MKNYDSPGDALSDLKNRGYNTDLATEHFCLYCGDLDMRLDPEEFHVDEVYRVKDNSSPDDGSVVYAISSPLGVKGTLIDGDSEHLNAEMAQKLRSEPPSSRA
jgi:hypothetical protein